MVCDGGIEPALVHRVRMVVSPDTLVAHEIWRKARYSKPKVLPSNPFPADARPCLVNFPLSGAGERRNVISLSNNIVQVPNEA